MTISTPSSSCESITARAFTDLAHRHSIAHHRPGKEPLKRHVSRWVPTPECPSARRRTGQRRSLDVRLASRCLHRGRRVRQRAAVARICTERSDVARFSHNNGGWDSGAVRRGPFPSTWSCSGHHGKIDDEVFAVAGECGVVHRKVAEERLEERRRTTGSAPLPIASTSEDTIVVTNLPSTTR